MISDNQTTSQSNKINQNQTRSTQSNMNKMTKRVTFNDTPHVKEYNLTTIEKIDKIRCWYSIKNNADNNRAQIREEYMFFITDGVTDTYEGAYYYWRTTQCYHVETLNIEGQMRCVLYGNQHGWEIGQVVK